MTDQELIDTAREHGYEYPSVPCGECGEPTYFLPGEPRSQESGHYLYHDHEEDQPATITEWEAERQFEELLGEIYDTVEICGYTFDAGRALKELDPIAFREEMLSYFDAEGIEIS